MTKRGSNKYQYAVTRHAKAKRWTGDRDFLYSVKHCIALVASFDPARHKYLVSIGATDKAFLKKYCELASIMVSKKERSTVTVKRVGGVSVTCDAFLQSYEWRRVRMVALKRDGARCLCCGAGRADGVVLHVDHIKPRNLFPNLALDVNNLQVLCEVCNHGKGRWDQTDWRDGPESLDPETEFDPAKEFAERFRIIG